MPEEQANGVEVGVGARTGPQTLSIVHQLVTSGLAQLNKGMPATYTAYRTIRLHPTVALARMWAVAPIVAGEWTVESDDGVPDERQKLIQDIMLPMREPLIQRIIEDDIDYGWSPSEKVFDRRVIDGTNRIIISNVKPLLVDITHILSDTQTGAFAGFTQSSAFGNAERKPLPLEYCLLVNDRVEGDNLYGKPLLENVRKTYDNWADANAGAERYDALMAGGLWVIHFPSGTSRIDGVEKDNDEIANDLIGKVQSAGAVAVPRVVPQHVLNISEGNTAIGRPVDAWEIEIKQHQGQQTNFIERLRYCDILLMRGMLTPERALMEGEHGTQAEAGEHIDAALTHKELQHRHVTRRLNWHVVDQLLALNWGEAARGTVRLVAAPLADATRAFFQTVYTEMLKHPTGSMQTIGQIDLDSLQDAVGIPKNTEVTQPVVQNPGTIGLDAEVKDRLKGLFKSAAGGDNGDGE